MVKILATSAIAALILSGCAYTQPKTLASYQKVSVDSEKVMSVKSSLSLSVKDGIIVGQVISDKKIPVMIENKKLIRAKGIDGIYNEEMDTEATQYNDVYVLNNNQKVLATVSIDSNLTFVDDTTATDTLLISTNDMGSFDYDVTKNLGDQAVKEAKLSFKVVEGETALSKTYKVILSEAQIQELIRLSSLKEPMVEAVKAENIEADSESPAEQIVEETMETPTENVETEVVEEAPAEQIVEETMEAPVETVETEVVEEVPAEEIVEETMEAPAETVEANVISEMPVAE